MVNLEGLMFQSLQELSQGQKEPSVVDNGKEISLLGKNSWEICSHFANCLLTYTLTYTTKTKVKDLAFCNLAGPSSKDLGNFKRGMLGLKYISQRQRGLLRMVMQG